MINDYSTTWFELFLASIAPAQTEHEVDFLARQLPPPRYSRVLDLCCGTGRHARLLVERGYEVTGVDRDARALALARELTGDSVRYVEGDMRRLGELAESFDAIASLWQSFGYFDEHTNQSVLRQIHAKLRPGGRCILDLYHRDFFEQNQGVRHFERGGMPVVERKRMEQNRLTVELVYGDGTASDVFDWQLYRPDELVALAEGQGFRCLLVCTDFDEHTAATPDKPRMQLVLERIS